MTIVCFHLGLFPGFVLFTVLSSDSACPPACVRSSYGVATPVRDISTSSEHCSTNRLQHSCQKYFNQHLCINSCQRSFNQCSAFTIEPKQTSAAWQSKILCNEEQPNDTWTQYVKLVIVSQLQCNVLFSVLVFALFCNSVHFTALQCSALLGLVVERLSGDRGTAELAAHTQDNGDTNNVIVSILVILGVVIFVIIVIIRKWKAS